jgi:hypothetical protein
MPKNYNLHIGSRFTFTVQDGSVNLFSFQPQENHLIIISDIISQIDSEVLVITPPFFEKVLTAYTNRTNTQDSLENNTIIQATELSGNDVSFDDFDIIFVISNNSFQQNVSLDAFRECDTPVISVLEEETIDSYNLYDCVYKLQGVDGETKDEKRRAYFRHLKDIYVPLNDTQLIKYELSVEIDTKDTVQ